MKLKTAVKRLEQQFGLVGVDYRVKTWEMYQPVSFWLFTDKYFISVLTNGNYVTNKGFYLHDNEFSKEQVNELATDQPFIRLEVSLSGEHYNKTLKFRVRNAQGFQNVLDKLANDPKYMAVLTERDPRYGA